MRSALKFLLLFIITGNQTSAIGQHTIPPDSLLADLRQYRATIEQKHIHPFSPETQAAFTEAADRLAAEIGTCTAERFFVELLRLSALVNDEHTMVWPTRAWQLPYRFIQCAEGMVIGATDSAHIAHAMHRVLAINELPYATIEARVHGLFKQDNPSFVSKATDWHFDDPSVWIGLGIVDRYTDIPLTLLSPAGDTLHTMLDAVPFNAPMNLVRADALNGMITYARTDNYWYQDDPATRTLYVQYRRCQEDPKLAFKDFNKQLFAHIAATQPENLVLDLRNNGGGNSAILKPFLKSIRSSSLNAEGRFIVLIAPGVFSSALMNAVELQRTTKATFVGQPTGASINHYGEVQRATLPHTGIAFTWSTKYWENWKGKNGGLTPDVVVPVSWVDLQQGIDRAYKVASGMLVGAGR